MFSKLKYSQQNPLNSSIFSPYSKTRLSTVTVHAEKKGTTVEPDPARSKQRNTGTPKPPIPPPPRRDRVPPNGTERNGSGSGPRASRPSPPPEQEEARPSTALTLLTGTVALAAAIYLAVASGETRLLTNTTAGGRGPAPTNPSSALGKAVQQARADPASVARTGTGRTYVIEVPETIGEPNVPPVAPEFAQTARELFNPALYQGRWYEVASMKLGFAGEGQQDCHCTTGIYRLVPGVPGKLKVSTFCVHGSPKGRISGLQGEVTCADAAALRLLPEFETKLERSEGVVEKCVLRFPSLPFIPAETYDILATDYQTFAFVQGSPDQSFVQIYSRTPNPGPAFLAEKKAYLASLGWDISKIRDTPQDCEEIKMERVMALMDSKGGFGKMDIGQQADGTLVPLEESGDSTIKLSGVALNPINPVESIKDLGKLIVEMGKALRNNG